MNNSRFFSILITIALTAVVSTAFSAAENNWHDTFYQYRIPVVLEAKEAGWNVVPVDEAAITTAINRVEEMQYEKLYFAYNYLKVAEIETDGQEQDLKDQAGFFLVPEGEELFEPGWLKDKESVEIPTENDAYYLLSYTAEENTETVPLPRRQASLANKYNFAHAPGRGPRYNNYITSHEPYELPKKCMNHEVLLLSDGGPMELTLRGRWVAKFTDISLRKVRIMFLANFEKAGRKNLMLYYQPMCSTKLLAPKLKHHEVPNTRSKLKEMSSAQKYAGDTRYMVHSDALAAVWFAETTVKLTPNTTAPEEVRDEVQIASAANERQSFQLVLKSKKPFQFKGIAASSLKNGGREIPAANITFNFADYIPISKSAYVTPARYMGMIADALVKIKPRLMTNEAGNQVIFVTVDIPPGTPAGTYKGHLSIKPGVYLHYKPDDLDKRPEIVIPVKLKVYDFELPEYSTFNCIMGGNYFAWKGQVANMRNFEYHGLSTKEELKKLVRKYFDIMAREKFYPYSPALYEEIGMKWDPPPQGYNVDVPGNYFKLYDWDFTEYNRILKHYIDDLKVNTFYIGHTNPKTSNIFKHLPGKELEELAPSAPHFVMGWQYYRDCTYVGWGKRKGDAHYDKTIEITQDQFDHLILDYYRTIAENLDKHGWLDYAYILINETEDFQRIKHFLEVLESDPLTARIKTVACVQSPSYFNYKEDGKYVFRELLDVFDPITDECYNWWERHYFEDKDFKLSRDRLWNYVVTTSRVTIDAPGINNRIIGLDVFNRGGSGYYLWGSICFQLKEPARWGNRVPSTNPWINPWTNWGNGAVAYFYPPRRNGPASEPDWNIIPSMRVMTHRESVDDYEYARMLEDLIAEGKKKGIDVSEGEKAMRDIERLFYNSVHWSQNDAWYLDLRDRIAKAIVNLKQEIK